jgi:putative ABC transport system substrate-binding protein
MRRREFITLLGGAAAAWPVVARAQKAAVPVIGILDSQSLDGSAELLGAFRQGLKDTGYVDGESVAIRYGFADNQMDRLSAMAAELVLQRVAVIVATSGPVTAVAAKATSTIPIVFVVPEDPVKLGLVTSLARPGGNMTGINFLFAELVAKRLGLLHELVPAAIRIALLVNPAEATITETTLREAEPAARSMGLQIQVLKASTSAEIDAAFAVIARDRPDALFVASGPFFTTRRVQLVDLASRHAIPATYSRRTYPEYGGLMSYGTDLTDAFRQAGGYVGRILKGEKPADLPVMQPTRFELIINLKTAKALGLTVPPTVLTLADEVIE